ncbi:hypothetical protein IWQ56_000265 [Coemansia nantahalensis]|nr:hypothetical protein IWQ56_000265 [Coemansia nantahalensis]
MSGVQRPLVIREEKSKALPADDARKGLQKFLSSEAGAQSASSATVQQLQQLHKALAAAGARDSDDSDDE